MSLKSVHMYRRVPTDLSKSTHSGGLLSLVAVGVMTMLLVSNLKAFASVKVERSIEIDQVYDETWVVSFNITLPNLPCALTSLDLTDALGTSVHNLTRGLNKLRIDEHTEEKLAHRPAVSRAPKENHQWSRSSPFQAIFNQELEGHFRVPPVPIGPSVKPPEFFQTIGKTPLAVVLFGASWCEWTEQFRPVVEYLRSQLQTTGLNTSVEVYHVDCTRPDAARDAPRLYFDDEADIRAAGRKIQESLDEHVKNGGRGAPNVPGSKVGDRQASRGVGSPMARRLLQAPEEGGAAAARKMPDWDAVHPNVAAAASKMKMGSPFHGGLGGSLGNLGNFQIDDTQKRAAGQPNEEVGNMQQRSAESARKWKELAKGAGQRTPGPWARLNGLPPPPNPGLCTAMHVVSYPTLKIYADGAPKDAFNYGGAADHDDIFAALLAQLRARPESKAAVAAFEERSEALAKPFVAQLTQLATERGGTQNTTGAHKLQKSIKAVREEALAAGVPAWRVKLGSDGRVGSEKPKPPSTSLEPSADGAEGCEVSGTIKVQRVPGTLRINAHAHFQSLEPAWVNLSHTIRTLTFAKTLNKTFQGGAGAHSMGLVATPVVNASLLRAVAPLKEGRNIHPLMGKHFQAKFAHSDIAHYIKVIPSSFSFESGEEGELYLYTANNRYNVRPGETPSINLGIDISPMRMLYREYYEEWIAFLTSTCAVIGGVFTVFGMVVTLLDTSGEAFSKKLI